VDVAAAKDAAVRAEGPMRDRQRRLTAPPTVRASDGKFQSHGGSQVRQFGGAPFRERNSQNLFF